MKWKNLLDFNNRNSIGPNNIFQPLICLALLQVTNQENNLPYEINNRKN